MKPANIILPCVTSKHIKLAVYNHKDNIDDFVDACAHELIERINYVSGKTLRIENPRLESTVDKMTINATIDTQSLPDLRDMAEVYQDFGFKDNLVATISKRSQAAGLPFQSDELDKPFYRWQSLWLTCYLAELSAASISRIADSDEKLLEALSLSGAKILNQMQDQ